MLLDEGCFPLLAGGNLELSLTKTVLPAEVRKLGCNFIVNYHTCSTASSFHVGQSFVAVP